MSGLMKRCWSTVPKKYAAGCLLFWCVGYLPRGAERKRFNKWALEQMNLYYDWEMQCLAKSGSGAADGAVTRRKSAAVARRISSTCGAGKAKRKNHERV